MTTRPQRIFDLLKRATAPLTAADIARALDDDTNPVSSDLSRMVRSVKVVGLVQRGKGKPQRLFRLRPWAVRPATPVGYVCKLPVLRTPEERSQPPVVRVSVSRPRKIVVVDGREMEVAWP